MITKKITIKITTFILSTLIATTAIMAQADQAKIAEPNFEVLLHVLVASNQTGQGEAVPAGLANVAKQVRNEFGTSSLRLINTNLGRLTNSGSLEYKGVSSAFAPEPEPGSPSFLELRLAGLKLLQNAAGQDVYSFQSFRFGARIPVRLTNFRDESGKSPAVVNYESIGLNLDRVNLRENLPTLIGTLTQPRTEGTLFLVLTVKNADK